MKQSNLFAKYWFTWVSDFNINKTLLRNEFASHIKKFFAWQDSNTSRIFYSFYQKSTSEKSKTEGLLRYIS